MAFLALEGLMVRLRKGPFLRCSNSAHRHAPVSRLRMEPAMPSQSWPSALRCRRIDRASNWLSPSPSSCAMLTSAPLASCFAGSTGQPHEVAMPKPKGIGMPKPKKSKIDGAGPSRNAGGRPRNRPAEPPSEESPLQAFADAAAPAAPAATPSTAEAAKPSDPQPPPAPASSNSAITPPWDPTPTDPPSGGWCFWHPNDRNWRYPSGLVQPRQLTMRQAQQKAVILKTYDNGACTCAASGEPAPGDPDFVEHCMFCQIYKCYAYEVGCCGPVVAASNGR